MKSFISYVKEVEVYVANPPYITTECKPRHLYVDTVLQGAREHHLPKEYIEKYLNWKGPFGT